MKKYVALFLVSLCLWISEIHAQQKSQLLKGSAFICFTETAYKVFPNPASGYFYIQGSFALPAVLELYDMMGRKVYRQPVTSNKQQVNVGNLASGLYIYRLISGGKAGRGKLMIE